MSLPSFRVPVLSLVAGGVALLFAACGGEAAAVEPTAVTTAETVATAAVEGVEATATVEAAGTSEAGSADAAPVVREAPDAARVMGHIEVLAGEIGVRTAGTEGERAAAAYIEGEFAAAGYETALEPFTAATRIDHSSAVTADGVTVRPYMMNGSGSGEATGRLVYGGLGSTADLEGLDLEGAVLLVDRGVLPFEEKARNAQRAGAVGVLIANNEAGPYGGSLGGWIARIPVVSIRQEEGELLRPLAGPEGEGVKLTLRAGVEQVSVESQNVVGRAGAACEVYLGAHYDSVPEGPGANDNASGAALLIEIARVHRGDGVCVVAFGAEEIGLFGSQAFVDEHDVSGAQWMLNFDMVGRLDGPIIVGDDGLTELILDALAGRGMYPIEAGSFPPFASSDHVSFSDAGVPAVTFNSGDDAAIHTSGDSVERVSVEAIEAFLGVVDAALAELVDAG